MLIRLRKYYRLKNGSFINLMEGNVDDLSKILSSLNVSSKNIEENKLYLDKQYAVYLDKAFTDKILSFTETGIFSID